jgi:hypothetical protein
MSQQRKGAKKKQVSRHRNNTDCVSTLGFVQPKRDYTGRWKHTEEARRREKKVRNKGRKPTLAPKTIGGSSKREPATPSSHGQRPEESGSENKTAKGTKTGNGSRVFSLRFAQEREQKQLFCTLTPTLTGKIFRSDLFGKST